MAEVFVHVGPPKTGSTYLQELLWLHREDLAAQGILLPVEHANEMWLAATDVQDGTFVHVDVPESRGAWARVARRVRAHGGRAVVSHELLGLSDQEHVGRIASSFGRAELHVVVMARSLAAVLPSLWQETVKMADPDQPWPRFLAEQEARRSPWTDATGIVRRWLAHVPPSRVHVVTVPPRGASPEVLLGRFSAAIGADTRGWAAGTPVNESLDAVQVELLRRFNRVAVDVVDRRTVQRLVNDVLVPRLARARGGRRLRVPPDQRPWIERETRRRRRDLEASGVQVHGSLDDLVATDDDWEPDPDRDPGRATDADLLAVALALVVDLVRSGRTGR